MAENKHNIGWCRTNSRPNLGSPLSIRLKLDGSGERVVNLRALAALGPPLSIVIPRDRAPIGAKLWETGRGGYCTLEKRPLGLPRIR